MKKKNQRDRVKAVRTPGDMPKFEEKNVDFQRGSMSKELIT